MKAMSHLLREHMASEYVDADIDAALDAVGDVATQADPSTRTQLWLTQLLLPDLLEAVERLIIDADDQPRVRRFAGGLLTYVYNPLDLIGDETMIGRLDDALVCALGLCRLRDLEKVELSAGIAAICELASRQLPHLNGDLQEGIRQFIRDLEGSSIPPGITAGR